MATVQVKPFFGRTDTKGGGIFTLHKGIKQIGRATVAFEHKEKQYRLTGVVPAQTAVLDSMELNEEERGKGHGAKLLREIEKLAKEQGMQRVYLTSVMGEAEGFWKKQGYVYSGRKRIWEKLIPSPTAGDKIPGSSRGAVSPSNKGRGRE